MSEEHTDPSLQDRVILGLARLSQVLKTQAWKGATPQKLTPTQGHMLRQLQNNPAGLSLGQLAHNLGITPATASDAVSMLVKKGLVSKVRRPENARQLLLTLTPEGMQEAQRSSGWTDFLQEAVRSLDEAEQGVLLQSLMKLLGVLQRNGQVSPVKMCLNCAFFQPDVYPGTAAPHHCQFLQAPLHLSQLQMDCADHQIQTPVP